MRTARTSVRGNATPMAAPLAFGMVPWATSLKLALSVDTSTANGPER